MSQDTAPRIITKPSLTQEDDGKKLLIQCEIEASPKPEIKWFKKNENLTESDRIKSRIEVKNNKLYKLYLEINNFTLDDSGEYKVNAKNCFGELSAGIALTFATENDQKKENQDGTSPSFLQNPTMKHDAEQKKICIEGKITANPEPTIRWTKDNIEIISKGRCSTYIHQLPDKTYLVCLEINNVNVEDAGNYKITAKNSLGETNGSISLVFDREDTSSKSLGKPVFVQNPSIRQQEDKVFFDCKITADPVPVITWYFENSIIKNNAKYKQIILTDATTHTLILEVNNFGVQDSGGYRIVAKNQHGETESTIKVNFK
jgi:hypothetical protein